MLYLYWYYFASGLRHLHKPLFKHTTIFDIFDMCACVYAELLI